MESCYDCIHSEVCSGIGSCSYHCSDVSKCKYFKNKADFVEKCHCEKCKHYELYEQIEDFDGRCTLNGVEFDKDFYCKYGERRDT